MKNIRKILAFICVLSLLASMAVFSTAAVPAPIFPGNVDQEYVYVGSNITVKDVTLLQKYLAGLEELNKAQQYCAEVDGDGVITIKDATMIQKYIADIIKDFNADYAADYTRSDCFYANFDSGKAMVGVPVTFTAEAYGGEEPFTYEYKINGELVRERSEDNTFTCTFDEAGTYNIEVVMYNRFDTTCTEAMEYVVVEPYTSDTVILKALYHNKNTRWEQDYTMTVTAEAFMGSGEYEYCFYYDGELVQDYSANNQLYIEDRYINNLLSAGDHDLTVYVRDTAAPDTVVEGSLDIYISDAVG